VRYCEVRLESTGKRVFFLGGSFEQDAALVEDMEDIKRGRSFAHWLPGIGAVRRGEVISQEITRLTPFGGLADGRHKGCISRTLKLVGGHSGPTGGGSLKTRLAAV
jgi:hypothetical protein